MGKYRRVEADIDLDAIRSNISAVKEVNPGRKTLLVIKADGYGHGAVRIAREMDDISDYLGVAEMDEALELRNAGIEKPVLILGYTDPSRYEDAVKSGITLAIFKNEDAEKLSDTALKLGKKAKVHIKVDSGMSRIGYRCTENDMEEAMKLFDMPGLFVEGIFTHYAKADEYDKTPSEIQYESFLWFVRSMEERGAVFSLRHIDNSAGAMELHSKGFDMMRLGIVIYGLYPSGEVSRDIALRPAMALRSRISHIKTVEPGTGVSYGWTYEAAEKIRIATVSAGYADGYPRALSGNGKVIIRGKYAPILGRVCMDQFMVDVTGIDDAECGDTVTLFGADGDLGISVEEIAEPANSFNYEAVCNIGRRVPRVYFKDGREAGEVNYLL